MENVTDYDIIGGDTKNEKIRFYTIGCLIELAEIFKNHNFRFLDTCYCPREITSWRGSYSTPAIDYVRGEVSGKELAKTLKKGLSSVHTGYKGGDYRYTDDEEFYVAQHGRSEEYKVVGYENKYNEIILLTRIDTF